MVGQALFKTMFDMRVNNCLCLHFVSSSKRSNVSEIFTDFKVEIYYVENLE